MDPGSCGLDPWFLGVAFVGCLGGGRLWTELVCELDGGGQGETLSCNWSGGQIHAGVAAPGGWRLDPWSGGWI